MFVYTAGRVVKKISTDDCICGVTSVDDELFVLLERDDNQVAVYSVNDYQLLRHLHLPGLKRHPYNDMTSCVRHKCLYVSNFFHPSCIHRFDLSGSAITKWSLHWSPHGLSITPNCNLLVTCYDKLVGLSADSGQCVCEITLQPDIENLRHAVQLTTGQFVVCHGFGYDNLHRVCLVDDEGKVTRSYGGQLGSHVGQLNWPRHLGVDKDSQFVFVADWFNINRVVLLSPTLDFLRYFSEGMSRSERLYLRHTTRRLYVSCASVIVVIQL